MQDGDTALILAASKGHFKVVELLIRNGAQVQRENKVIRCKGLLSASYVRDWVKCAGILSAIAGHG